MTKHNLPSLQIYLAGLGAATLLATTSNAAVVMMDVSSISGNSSERFTTTRTDVNLSSLTAGGLTGSLTIWNGGWFADGEYIGLNAGSGTEIAFNGAVTSPKAFRVGEMIDGNSSFTNDHSSSLFFYRYYYSSASAAPSWGEGSYLGFVSNSDGDNYYGWLEVTWDQGTKTFQILSGAYESEANLGILVGIPEPSSLALLAAGAAGVAALRRRKKAA